MTARPQALDLRGFSLALPQWASEAAFVALLLIVFVGRSPFAPPLPLLAGGLNPTGAGDAVRQAYYLSVLAFILWGALQAKGLAAFKAIPPLL
ncbi:MAG: hypothetical protein JOZ55_11980, partial [Alphaproteobacteria bacterium]|nr:hypothetical protein [Alphaproteobacteria bacterium]